MSLTFSQHPDVTIASNTFRNVPTILQYEDTPLIEVGKFEPAGYTTRFPVYHSDGTQIAVVKGSRIFLTEAGKLAKLVLRQEDRLTVCEFEGRPILELRRQEAQALSGWAELYAPEGVLVKANDSVTSAMLHGDALTLPGGMVVQGCYFDGCRIGIWIKPPDVALGVF